MDRLSFIGDSAMGVLSFSPTSGLRENDTDNFSLAELGIQAQAIYDGQTEEVLQALVNVGSIGGARPKAQRACHGIFRIRKTAKLKGNAKACDAGKLLILEKCSRSYSRSRGSIKSLFQYF